MDITVNQDLDVYASKGYIGNFNGIVLSAENIEKLMKIVNENYDSEMCGATSEWSQGNSDDVFSDGQNSGRSWLAYEIGCLLGMKLEEPEEPKYSWEE